MIKYQKKLKELIDEKRLNHALRVSIESKKLASHWKINKKQASIAGLLHDCAKNLTITDLKKYNIRKTKVAIHENFKSTWH